MSKNTNYNPRQEYLDHRELLWNTEKEVAFSFDKTIITLSASALGLSLTFLSKDKPCPNNPKELWLIILSWGLLALSVITTLIDTYLCRKIYGFRFNITDLDENIRLIRSKRSIEFSTIREHKISIIKSKKSICRYECWSRFLNIFALISFVFGIAALVIFVSINF